MPLGEVPVSWLASLLSSGKKLRVHPYKIHIQKMMITARMMALRQMSPHRS